jgi:hypothetical protein
MKRIFGFLKLRDVSTLCSVEPGYSLNIWLEMDKLHQIKVMETKYFSLGPSESSATVKVIRILFGLICIGIAVFWAIFNIRSARSDTTLWVTILFLSGFGLYQIWAGMGRADRFIQIENDRIVLKKNSFLPEKELHSSDITNIEIYPLNLIFHLKPAGKMVLRFGTTYTDNIEPIKMEIEEFATRNNLSIETISEEI